MKKILALVIFLFALIFGIVLVQNSIENKGSLFTKTPTATINNHKFNLKVAKTAKEKEVGLSETKSLSADNGMFFSFDKPDYYSFWMKNMNFPIDIIFIRDDTIVTIYENAKPPQNSNENIPIYQPKDLSDGVIEINSGLSSKYGFTKGDKVKFENL